MPQGPPPAGPRPANVDAGGFPRRHRLSCAKERSAQPGAPASRAHRIIKGIVFSRGYGRKTSKDEVVLARLDGRRTLTAST